MIRKLFVTLFILAIFATGCIPTKTQIEDQTGATMEDVEPAKTQVPGPKESVYDTYWVKRYQGAKVTIESVEFFNDHFKVTLKTLHGAEFSYYEWDSISLHFSIQENGLTYRSSRYFSNLQDDDVKEIEKTVQSLKEKVWTYEIGAMSPNGLVSNSFVEVYTPTNKDIEIEKLLNNQLSQNNFWYPTDGIEELLRSYSEWGTKEGLDDFLKLINHPRSTDLYYSIIDEDEELKSLPTTGLDITLLGKVEDFGEFQVIIYENRMIPDVFKSKIQDFPIKVIFENREFEFVPFTDSYEVSEGTVFRFLNRELIVPKGSIMVILKATSQQCEHWSPLIVNQVLGIYR